MKKKFLVLAVMFGLLQFGSGLNLKAETSDKTEPKAIRITPPAPKFTDAERQAELAKRRAKVFEAMNNKSAMILFSAEPKIYTNDVDFMYRQENNLYYLTNLKQNNATLVLLKDGANRKEILFLPKRSPQAETWLGRMYSRENATRISGVKMIVDASELNDFLQSVKSKTAFTSKDNSVSNSFTAETLYLLTPESPRDNDGMREFRKENAQRRLLGLSFDCRLRSECNDAALR
ncbi:MAG: aminopeptidase P N-terminal domain-containing protein [Acidobacteria bacterium]|nr:aminopeptidase P N-terminal domain-containing protein [Acidobacteriota bacterium]